jgi:hypothetical protein
MVHTTRTSVVVNHGMLAASTRNRAPSIIEELFVLHIGAIFCSKADHGTPSGNPRTSQ